MSLFAAVIFLSAFLLFQIQPILGRYVLPWFGGTPAVWTNCLLFFQCALLAGYGYAHWLGSLKKARTQAIIHTVLLGASLLMLPIIPSEFWKPADPSQPSLRILMMLAATAGAPYLLLSATAPLLQRWYSWTGGVATWRLYALSNLGSFLALLSYPFLVEPWVRLNVQAWAWSIGYVALAALCILTAWRVKTRPVEQPEQEGEAPSLWTVLLWLALAATGSTVLMATTNEVSQEIAVSPFLWVIPLAIYLLTFVLTFESDRWYKRVPFSILTGILGPVAGVVTSTSFAAGLTLRSQLAVYLVALFVVCMLCHGELVKARPAPRYLTLFYLCVAAGGALGGAFTALLAPRIFRFYDEYPLAMAAACFLGVASWMRTGAWAQWTGRNLGLRASLMALMIGGVSSIMTNTGYRPPLASSRNFYGILRVNDVPDKNGTQRILTHGRIKHGFQYQTEPLKHWPTSYYGPHSGVAYVLNGLPDGPRRIAVVGLGTGTMAAWGRPGDSVQFYEINPDVVSLAQQWFTYLKDSKATTGITLGDARVQLERAAPGNYDLLAVDAFSSDAIPVHLLTAEAARIYARHVSPGGALMFHISNRSLNLEPVIRALSESLGWRAGLFLSPESEATGESGSRWVVLTRSQALLQSPQVSPHLLGWTSNSGPPILWTDDFASLWHVLRF